MCKQQPVLLVKVRKIDPIKQVHSMGRSWWQEWWWCICSSDTWQVVLTIIDHESVLLASQSVSSGDDQETSGVSSQVLGKDEDLNTFLHNHFIIIREGWIVEYLKKHPW